MFLLLLLFDRRRGMGWSGGGVGCSRFQSDEFSIGMQACFISNFSISTIDGCSLAHLSSANRGMILLSESTQFHVANLSSTLNFKISAPKAREQTKVTIPNKNNDCVYFFNFFKWKISRFFFLLVFAREKSNRRIFVAHFSRWWCVPGRCSAITQPKWQAFLI